jgi:diaminopimelate epimerase
MASLTLTKHHGLGNDFLVVVGPNGVPPGRGTWSSFAGQVCHRRHGIGADGLIVATEADDAERAVTGAEVAMRLYNSDGSTAEMSGNGIRCLVQGWARAHGRERGAVVVATDAGPRRVDFAPGTEPNSIVASVDMGPVTAVEAPAGWPDVAPHEHRPVAHLSLGNPHTVVAVEDVGAVDLHAVGQQLPDVNLEIVEPGPEPSAITMRVHERGAGITEACGTGACAAAWAAASWGLAEPAAGEITVHMDGGDARVRLDDPAPGRVTLIGPATFVGAVEVEL